MAKKLEADTKPYSKFSKSRVLVPAIAGAVILLGVGFLGGMQYQKGQSTTTTASTAGVPSLGTNSGMGRMGLRGGFGEVTAVTATSITVSETRSGASTSYVITSSTKVTKDSAAAAVTDIAVGDTVIVQTSTSDTKQATSIVINPQMPSGPMNTQGDPNLQAN